MKYALLYLAIVLVCSANGQIVFEQTISKSINDAEQDVATMNLTNGTLAFGYKDNRVRYTGLRFTDVTIPKGSEILTTHVQFRAGSNSDSENLSFIIHGDDTTDALPFTYEENNITDRIITSSSVAWAPGPWVDLESGENQKTPDLSTIIQEIIDTDGWESGNAIVLIFEGSSFTSGYVDALSYDEIGLTGAPRLRITYQEASGIDPRQAILSWGIQPNPASGSFSLNINSTDNSPVSVSLIDGSGKEIQKLFKGSMMQQERILNFDISQLGIEKGLYFIRLTQNQLTQTRKLIIY